MHEGINLLADKFADKMAAAYVAGVELTRQEGSNVELKRIQGIGVVSRDMYNMCNSVRLSGYETEWGDITDSDLTDEERADYLRRRDSHTFETALLEATTGSASLLQNVSIPSLGGVLTRASFSAALQRHNIHWCWSAKPPAHWRMPAVQLPWPATQVGLLAARKQQMPFFVRRDNCAFALA